MRHIQDIARKRMILVRIYPELQNLLRVRLIPLRKLGMKVFDLV